MSNFRIDTTAHEGGMVVRLRGDATCTDTEALRAALLPIAQERSRCVVVDLADLDFINSMAIGVLLELRHDLAAAGSAMHLARPRGHIAGVLRKTRLVDLFPLYDTPEDALRPSAG